MNENARQGDEVQQSSALEKSQQETMAPGLSAESHADQQQQTTSPTLTESFGRYEILKELGKGAMGAVYLAYDTQLEHRVALKIPRFSEQDGPQHIQRFYREARSAFKLRHPNICPVYDVAEIDGQHYIAMAFIEGHPLSDMTAKKRPLPERKVARIIRKLALALAEAHEVGVVHRDLKPANIMIDGKNKEPIVMDFGLARLVDSTAETQITQAGTLLGSPAYMSPEQVAAEHGNVGPSSDIYSLGVVMYQMLTGELPFQGSLATILGRIAVEDPDPLSYRRPSIDQQLEDICMKAMSKSIKDRYATMQEFARALTDHLKSNGTTTANIDKATIADPPVDEWEDEFELPAALPPRVNSARKSRSPKKTGRRKKKGSSQSINPVWLVAGGTAGTAIVLGLIALLINGNRDGNTKQSQGNKQIAAVTTAKVPQKTTPPSTPSVVTEKPQPVEIEPQPKPNERQLKPHDPPFRPNDPADMPPGKQPPFPFEKDFTRADRNSDGKLDPTEMLRHIIRRADKNQDDFLTRSEFDEAVRQQGEALFRPPDRGSKPPKRPRGGEFRPKAKKGLQPKKFD